MLALDLETRYFLGSHQASHSDHQLFYQRCISDLPTHPPAHLVFHSLRGAVHSDSLIICTLHFLFAMNAAAVQCKDDNRYKVDWKLHVRLLYSPFSPHLIISAPELSKHKFLRATFVYCGMYTTPR